DDVSTAAHICCDGGFRPHVLPTLGVDADFDTRHLGEFLRVGGPHVFVALHEALPPQHAELGAFLRFEVPGLLRGRVRYQQARAERGACGNAGSGFQEFTTLVLTHRFLLCKNAVINAQKSTASYAPSDIPLAASNKCAWVGSGSKPTRSPG